MKQESNKKKLYFIVIVLFLTLYLILLNATADARYWVSKIDGEERYYLEQMPVILAGQQSEIDHVFFRIGIPLLAMGLSSILPFAKAALILGFNVVLFAFLVYFLYWKFIPMLFTKLKVKLSDTSLFLVTLLVVTNPVLIKYIFSAQPDSVLFAMLIMTCYMMTLKKDMFWQILGLMFLTMIFKEGSFLFIPFFIVYFFDREGFTKKAVIYSILMTLVIVVAYFVIYKLLFLQYSDFMTNKITPDNKDVLTDSPFSYRTPSFDILSRYGTLYITALILFKMFLTYGLLWWPMLKSAKSLFVNKNILDLAKNTFYLLYPIAAFLLVVFGTGTGEKYFFYISLMPYFYLFTSKLKWNFDISKKTKFLLLAIFVNIFSLAFYFLIH